MAYLKGKGAMTDVNLVIPVYDNAVTKDGRTRYLGAQVDHRDPRGADQANLHLVSKRVELPDGKARYDTSAPYSVGQLAAIQQAAGSNTTPLLNKADEQVGTVYGVKANLFASTRGAGLVINTNKPMATSDFPLDASTLPAQFRAMKDASVAHRRDARAAEPTAEAAPAPQPALPQPALPQPVPDADEPDLVG